MNIGRGWRTSLHPAIVAGAAAPAVSPYIARGYDHKFFWTDPCNPPRVGYNRGMKQQMIDEEKAARLRVMAFGLVYPGVVLLGIAIEKIFG